MPTARQPAILASCPATLPTAPLAAETTTVSPAFGTPIWPSPIQAVMPGIPAAPSQTVSGRRGSGSFMRPCPSETRESLPAQRARGPVALGEFRVPRRDDRPDGAADHHLAQLDACRVGLALVHAAAHVGIERQPVHPDEDSPSRGLADRRLDEAEIRFLTTLGAGRDARTHLQVRFRSRLLRLCAWRAIVASLRQVADDSIPCACRLVPRIPLSSARTSTMTPILVFDIETIPDVAGLRRLWDLPHGRRRRGGGGARLAAPPPGHGQRFPALPPAPRGRDLLRAARARLRCASGRWARRRTARPNS